MSSKLKYFENEVKEKIKASDVPYLGLIENLISESAYNIVYSELKNASGGKFVNVERWLKQFPALFASYMVKGIQVHFGNEAGNSVYGALLLAFGLPKKFELKQHERESLWRVFRRACNKLELPLSNRQFGPNYMVDTYLEQVGVPDARIGKVWNEMKKFAKKNGLPDEFNIAEQNAWFEKFRSDLKNTFPPRLKRALENDVTGYYLAYFLENLEQIKDKTTSKELFEHRTLPVLSYDGEILMLRIFPNDSEGCEIWEINIDDEQQRIEVDDHQHDIFLDLRTEKVSAKMSDGTDVDYYLWEDDKDDQLAFFDDSSNRFISSHNLGEEGIVLSPGRYRVLSRFDINESWLQTDETHDEGFYTGELELASGAMNTIEYGPATFIVRAHSQAVISLKGNFITPYAGPVFYSSDSLLINARLPKEWSLDGEYEIEIRSPKLEKQLLIPVLFDENHNVEVTLSKVTGQWPDGVDRITISLKRVGQSRALARSSAVIWFGLESLEQGYKPVCRNPPENLKKERCENIRIDNNRLVVKDQNVPFSSLCFSLSGQRELSLKFALPGTYIYLDDTNADVRREVLVRPGTTLSVSYDDRRLIRIYSTEDGVLRLGERIFHDDFKKRPWVKFSVAALVDHIDSESSNLVFSTHTYDQVLLNLVSPHLIRDWKTVQETESVSVEFTAFSLVEQIVVTATELLTNNTHQQSYHTNQGLIQSQPGELGGMLISQKSSEYKNQQLELYVDNLSDGLWFLKFNALIAGKWGSLSNERKDQYVIGLIIENKRISRFNKNCLYLLERFNSYEKNRLLGDLNSILTTCYEASSWESISWMKTVWHRLINDQDVMSDENIKRILPITEQLPDENSSESWISMLHIGGYKPFIYSRDASIYNRMDIGSSTNMRCFKAMNESRKDLAKVISSELVVDALVTAFQNKQKIITERVKPKNLNLAVIDKLYEYIFIDNDWERMLRDDKEPALGDLLGGFHLAYAQNECLKNIRRTLSGYRYLRESLKRISFRFLDNDSTIMPCLIPEQYLDNDEREYLMALSHLASGIAKTCRHDARGTNDLPVLLDNLENELIGDNKNILPVLSFFMGIAGDLFHYYLLLWEIYYESREA